MNSSARGLLILNLVCLCLSVSTLENSKFRKIWQFNGSNGRIRPGAFDPETRRFVFASCNEDGFPKQLSCVISVEAIQENGVTSSVKMCHLHISASKDKNLTLSSLESDRVFNPIQFMGPSKIIVAWDEENLSPEGRPRSWSKNVTILDFATCRIKHLGFNVDMAEDKYKHVEISTSNVVVYPDTFDVFIADKEKCEGAGKCRLTYNLDGDKVNGPEAISTDWPSNKVEPALQNSSSKGFFVVNQFLGNTEIIHVATNGTKSPILAAIGYQVIVKSSNSHGNYTFCARTSVERAGSEAKGTVIRCKQYDIDNFIQMIDANLTYSQRIDQFAVLNLPKGGFLVFAIECSIKENDYSVQYSAANASVIKVDNDGNKSMSFLQELEFEPAQISCVLNRPVKELDIWIYGGRLCYYISYAFDDPLRLTDTGSLVFQTECFANQKFD